MKKTIETAFLTFKTHQFRNNTGSFSEPIGHDNPMHTELAKPLYDAGITEAGISERMYYHRNTSKELYHDLGLLLQGQLRAVIDGQAYNLKPGDLMVCPAGTSFGRSSGPSGMWWLYFNINDISAWQPIKTHGAYVRSCESATLIFLLLREILDARKTQQPAAIACAQDNSRMLVNILHRELIQNKQDDSKQASDMQELLNSIRAAPGKDWNRSTMAAKLNLSISQTKRIFQKKLGMSPLKLVIRQRMDHATHLLANTDLKIGTIAANLGYDSLHSFTRLFHKYLGMPPGQYRARFHSSGEPSRSAT